MGPDPTALPSIGVADVVHRVRDRYESEGMRGVLSSGYHVLETRAARFRYRHTPTARTDADPFAIRRVDPRDIEYVSGLEIERRETGRHLEYVRRPWYHRCAEYGDVLDGAWDAAEVRFADLVEWTLIAERFGEGIPWTETSVYEEFVACIERGHPIYGCSTVGELHERFEYLEDLKKSMASKGYRRVTRIDSDGAVGVGSDGAAALDEVTVDIGRDGELLHHTNGRHRLALAKVLDIPEIPVLVKVRHADWQRTRDRVSAGEDVDYPVLHPDLVDVADASARSDGSPRSTR
ncbi:hypothetical protein [Halopenitus persicus]|uniref:hypothetical protein n=1 Tax=Halopenitus persicus TaxID=1048396 RepID=UPI000BBB4A5C|nr:hypothetical protein [Halopenitus persicus]